MNHLVNSTAHGTNVKSRLLDKLERPEERIATSENTIIVICLAGMSVMQAYTACGLNKNKPKAELLFKGKLHFVTAHRHREQ